MTSVDGTEPDGLARHYGMGTATFVVISSMVGTGVLSTSGYTVLETRSNALMLALWVVGGVAAICGALCLAELSAALPRAGGDYAFLYEAYGPLAAFLSGWVSFLLGFGAPIAASSLAGAQYLTVPFLADHPHAPAIQKALATAGILLLALAHSIGGSRSARVQGTTTVIKIAVLSGLAVCGIAAGWGRWSNLLDWPTSAQPPSWKGVAFSMVYINYAYTGWNGAGYLAGEVRDPQRRLPRAILLGTAIVMALYLALNVMYTLALPAQAIQSAPMESIGVIAEMAARELFGSRISGVLSVALGLTMLASVSAFILTGPRIAYAMARAGQFPHSATRLNRFGAPGVAIAFQVAWAILLVWWGTLKSILEYASVGLALFSMLTITSVFVLRRRQPNLLRPFRVPGYPLVPILYLAITGALTLAAFLRAPWPSSLALGSILVGIPVYALAVRRPHPAS
jgi:APA family basic amino acid/polyamine antiporter